MKRKNLWLLAPSFGALAFLLLYYISTFFYPGGSQFNKGSKSFSWTQNYWCNLLNEKAINGQFNSARPIAFTAMFVLCLTLIVFWYIFPSQIGVNNVVKRVTQISGLIAMTTGMFIFTNLHDTVINIATIFGLFAITGTFIGLAKLKWVRLFWMGIFNLVLIALNNLIYLRGRLIALFADSAKDYFFIFFVLDLFNKYKFIQQSEFNSGTK